MKIPRPLPPPTSHLPDELCHQLLVAHVAAINVISRALHLMLLGQIVHTHLGGGVERGEEAGWGKQGAAETEGQAGGGKGALCGACFSPGWSEEIIQGECSVWVCYGCNRGLG